jgi:hypothetical protein
MSNHEALITALESGEQCDQDGVMIKVSRQAVHEAIAELRAASKAEQPDDRSYEEKASDMRHRIRDEATVERMKAYPPINAEQPGPAWALEMEAHGIRERQAERDAMLAAAPAQPADAVALLKKLRIRITDLHSMHHSGPTIQALAILDQLDALLREQP